METNDLTKLLAIIEENIKASEETGFPFIDPLGFKRRIILNQCQVIYGRRGTGKTTILKTLNEVKDHKEVIFFNLEQFKYLWFPDSIIVFLISLLNKIRISLNKEYSLLRFKRKIQGYKLDWEIGKNIDYLADLLDLSDKFKQELKSKRKTKGRVHGKMDPINVFFESTGITESNKEYLIEKRKKVYSKLGDLRVLFAKIIKHLNNKDIFILLDDYYYIKDTDQPKFIDYLWNLSKSLKIHLKIATIRHRSTLFEASPDGDKGIELNQDAQVIDLDRALEKFDDLLYLNKSIFEMACERAEITVHLEYIASDDAFIHLCLGSGGIPRDFLSTLKNLLIEKCINNNIKIRKHDVISKFVGTYYEKFSNLRQRDFKDTIDLEKCLTYIQAYAIEKNFTNCILINNESLLVFNKLQKFIKLLMDLRWLHLIDDSFSKIKHTTDRYSAYLLDYSLLPYPVPIGFDLLENIYDDNHQYSATLRKAPILDFKDLNDYLMKTGKRIKFDLKE